MTVIAPSELNLRIPVYRYTPRDFLQPEKDRLWSRVWQLVCRADEVAEPGAYFEYAIGDRSYLIVRDEDTCDRAAVTCCRLQGPDSAIAA